MKTAAKIEFGDFQTPLELARGICALLRSRGGRPDVVVEPTCGLGAFLEAAAEAFPKARLRGFDINADYVQSAGERLQHLGAQTRAVLRQQDFFAQDWETEFRDLPGRLLILGNLPWVTNQAVTIRRHLLLRAICRRRGGPHRRRHPQFPGLPIVFGRPHVPRLETPGHGGTAATAKPERDR